MQCTCADFVSAQIISTKCKIIILTPMLIVLFCYIISSAYWTQDYSKMNVKEGQYVNKRLEFYNFHLKEQLEFGQITQAEWSKSYPSTKLSHINCIISTAVRRRVLMMKVHYMSLIRVWYKTISESI